MATIDADTHVIESDRTWDYLSRDEQRFRPIPVITPEGRPLWIIGNAAFPRGGARPTVEVSSAMRECLDMEARRAHMDALGVDVQVIFPSLFLHPISPEPEVEVALARAYNRFLAEACSFDRARFKWAVVPPVVDMDAAVEEVHAGAKAGACAVFLRGIEGRRFLNDSYFHPLYAAAQEHNLAIAVHAGTGNPELAAVWHADPFFGLIMPTITAFQLIVSSDLHQRFPELRFGFLEAGAAWVPAMVQEARRRVEWWKGGHLEADLVRARNCYVATRTDDDLPYVLKWCGPEVLVCGTDYGHTDVAAEIDALKTLRSRGNVDPRIIDRILDDNARTLFAL